MAQRRPYDLCGAAQCDAEIAALPSWVADFVRDDPLRLDLRFEVGHEYPAIAGLVRHEGLMCEFEIDVVLVAHLSGPVALRRFVDAEAKAYFDLLECDNLEVG